MSCGSGTVLAIESRAGDGGDGREICEGKGLHGYSISGFCILSRDIGIVYFRIM